jgi:hypothetical protein
LSAQETCFCASEDGCQGGDLNTPWSYIAQQGLSVGGQNNNTGPFSDLGTCTPFSLPHCFHHGPKNTSPFPAEGTPGCPNVASGQSPSCPNDCTNPNAKAPYNDFKTSRYAFSGSVQTFGDVASIQQAIMTDGPVEAAFTVMSDFENYASGIYKSTSSKELGGHAIRIVGVSDGILFSDLGGVLFLPCSHTSCCCFLFILYPVGGRRWHRILEDRQQLEPLRKSAEVSFFFSSLFFLKDRMFLTMF